MQVIVVGAGLSALVCALRLLEDETIAPLSITIVEGRNRVGGRLYNTASSVDLGAAWTWPAHDVRLGALADQFGIKRHPQQNDGADVVQRSGRFVQGTTNWSRGTWRFEGGTAALTDAIAKRLRQLGCEFLFSHVVTEVRVRDGDATVGGIVAESKSPFVLTAHAVVLAAPPRAIASRVSFHPPLKDEMLRVMRATPTWMANMAKVVWRYPSPWWRTRGLSGAAMLEGPLVQVWDNTFTNTDGTQVHALAAFVPSEDMATQSALTKCLADAFGDEAHSASAVEVQNWSREELTADGATEPGSTHFGHPALHQSHAERLWLGGTETEPGESGHMEGAVKSGERIAAAVGSALKSMHKAEL